MLCFTHNCQCMGSTVIRMSQSILQSSKITEEKNKFYIPQQQLYDVTFSQMHINIPSRSLLEMDSKPRLRRKRCFPLKSGILHSISGLPLGRGKSNGSGRLMLPSEGMLSYCSGGNGLCARQRSNLRSSYSINKYKYIKHSKAYKLGLRMQFYATDSKSLFLPSICNSVLLRLIHFANNNKNYKNSTKFQKMKC